jgi:hypothetical protein
VAAAGDPSTVKEWKRKEGKEGKKEKKRKKKKLFFSPSSTFFFFFSSSSSSFKYFNEATADHRSLLWKQKPTPIIWDLQSDLDF